MRKKYITLDSHQLLTLQEGYKNHPAPRVRNRFKALLLSHQGYAVSQIAHILEVIPLSVYSWFSGWESEGLVGLLTKKGQGKKPILTEQDALRVKESVQANAQKLSLVREQLKAELNKEFSTSTLKRFLKSLVVAGKG